MKLKIFLAFTAGVLLMSCVLSVSAAPYKNYVPSYHYKTVEAPQAYIPNNLIILKQTSSKALPSYTDMAKDSKGNLYFVDKANSKIVVINANYEKISEITAITTSGKSSLLKTPEGIFITTDNTIYIADTGNARIIVLDTEFSVKKIFTAPESELFSKEFVYRPIRIAVDKAGRIYVIARNENRGLIELGSDGSFTGFLGASLVTPSITNLLFKKFAPREMRERIQLFVPTEYNSVNIDTEGFLMVTTDTLEPDLISTAINARSTDSRGAPVRKLNATGVDILQRNGFRPPVGDVTYEDNAPSRLIDVTVGSYGLYSVLDNRRSRIFTYDGEGNLLYTFGTRGDVLGATRNPTSIERVGNDILVLDGQLGTLTVYSMTEYGSQINELVAANYDGRYDDALQLSNRILELNANNDLACDTIARVAYQKGEYQKAYDYAVLANNRRLASKAFKYIRKDVAGSYVAPLVIVISILIVISIIKSLIKLLREKKQIYCQVRRKLYE